jgi:hypothetical protein
MESNNKISYKGMKESLYPEEVESVRLITNKFARKAKKHGGFQELKLIFKNHGNVEGTHLRKTEADIHLITKNKTFSIKKENGNKKEDYRKSNSAKWNITKDIQNALSVLEEKLKFSHRNTMTRLES